jgi:voltage-gated potassium channel
MNINITQRNVFQGFIIVLIIVDLVLLMFITFSTVSQPIFLTIVYFDLLVCFILFADFIHRIRQCEDKKVFIKKNWTDIIAMAPLDILYFSPITVPPNYMFIIRLFRFTRLIALFRREWKYISSFFKQTHINFAMGMLLFTMFAGTILFYLVEHSVNPEVHTFWDALWFTVTTMISGNSNIVPSTYYGEGISVLMMLIGISFVGILTASLASWLISKSKNNEEDSQEEKLENLQTDITKIKTDISNLTEDINELKILIKNNR